MKTGLKYENISFQRSIISRDKLEKNIKTFKSNKQKKSI